MKLSEKLIVIPFEIIYYLLLIFSILGVGLIHLNLYKNQTFSITPLGFTNYLKSYSEYSTLFGTTLTIVVAKFTLMQWSASINSSNDKIKGDKFKEWCFQLDRRIREIEVIGTDKNVVENFISLRTRLFNVLFDMNMSVVNKTDLYTVVEVFEVFIQNFEELNSSYQSHGGIYPTQTYLYSFKSFRFLLMNSIEKRYSGISEDLEKWYLLQINPDRDIQENINFAS